MAKKGGKSSGAKRGKSTARKPTTKPASRAPSRAATRKQGPANPRPARRPAGPAEPSPLQRAERLRDDVRRSKVTHPDPWRYTAKARGWAEHAQRLVEDAAAGRDIRRALDALATKVEGDPDFKEARRLF